MLFENPSNKGASVIVGANVHEVRKDLGWSQVTLGQKAGLRQGYTALERGERSPTPGWLFDLAGAFSVAPARLVVVPTVKGGKG
jgi:transcriptional regulator with XRE-family HTH domain